MAGLSSIMLRLRRRQLLRKVVNTTIWQLIDKVSRLLVNLLIGTWVARYLGPSRFGLLNYAIAFVALFSPISDLGLQSIVVRELIRRPDLQSKIISSAFALRLAGATAAALLALLYVFESRPADVLWHLMVFAVALSLFPQAWDVIDYEYQSRMHVRPIIVIRTISVLVFAGTRVALILSKAEVTWFALMVAGEAALSACLMWIIYNRQWSGLRLAATWSEMKSLLLSSWPLAISSASVMLYMRIDQVMLGQMGGDHEVGIFSAAVRLSESWFFIPMAIVAAVVPALTSEFEKSTTVYVKRLVVFTRLMLMLSLACAGALTLWSRPIVALLYGAGYADAGAVLKIHAWAGVFVGMGLAGGPWFLNTGMLKIRMVHTLIGAFINIGLNVALIPHYGAFGSAVSTLISYSFAAMWLNAFSKKTLPLFFIQLKSAVFLP